MKNKAVRNIKLCTKDCLCLYVCPTGASDTENGQIDWDKCIGCGACANACVSHAISMVPYKYPAQQEKTVEVKNEMMRLAKSKIEQKQICENLSFETTGIEKIFYKALALSNKAMSEDIVREASFLIPQGKYSIELLEKILDNSKYPKEKIEDLLGLLKK